MSEGRSATTHLELAQAVEIASTALRVCADLKRAHLQGAPAIVEPGSARRLADALRALSQMLDPAARGVTVDGFAAVPAAIAQCINERAVVAASDLRVLAWRAAEGVPLSSRDVELLEMVGRCSAAAGAPPAF